MTSSTGLLTQRIQPHLPADAAGGAAIAAALVAVPVKDVAAPWLVAVVGIVAAVVVVSPVVRRSPWTWIGLGALHAVFVVRFWYRIDNHDFLLLWTLLALAVAFAHRNPEEAFATQARWLVGLAFALATGWKLLSGEFLDGSFFVHAQLVDPRFARVAELIGGLDPETAIATREAIAASVREPIAAAVSVPADQVRTLAIIFTAWGVALEGAIAVAMLGPDRPRWRAARSGLLLTFMATTYLVVPVVRFGLLLAALGIGQARGRWRTAFWWSIPALLAWTPIWQALQG
ncbi:MAG: hypothetical protein R3249_00045 [Nitriliruptorales bacterium]|nr:hypothetical protein [Nitriliruptorales bacterium]